MKKLNILVVDDEPGIRSGINRILRNFTVGYPFMEEDFCFEMTDAETGEQAIEIINQKEIDIVLLDNNLPGIHGIEVLEYIKNKSLDIYVMMITSYASLDLAVKATNNGAYNFVPKPFTPDELKTAIEGITKHLFLKRMTRKMKEEGKAVRFQFLQVLSHELKSPINAIEGYLQIMKDKQAGDQIESYKVMIDRSIERLKGMRTLIIDLLDLTKLESGKKSREMKKVDLSEIIRIAKDTMEPLAIQKNVKINLDAAQDIYLTADSEELEIIMNNLISNAVKYNKEGGQVHIQSTKSEGKIRITVEDTGIGMTEEETLMLFKDFVRIKNAKTRNITGSGLGLSILQKMVSLYDGEISVESQPDIGSKFTVLLPQN
jgi:two-component system, sensor histidine kinase and response regulator